MQLPEEVKESIEVLQVDLSVVDVELKTSLKSIVSNESLLPKVLKSFKLFDLINTIHCIGLQRLRYLIRIIYKIDLYKMNNQTWKQLQNKLSSNQKHERQELNLRHEGYYKELEAFFTEFENKDVKQLKNTLGRLYNKAKKYFNKTPRKDISKNLMIWNCLQFGYSLQQFERVMKFDKKYEKIKNDIIQLKQDFNEQILVHFKNNRIHSLNLQKLANLIMKLTKLMAYIQCQIITYQKTIDKLENERNVNYTISGIGALGIVGSIFISSVCLPVGIMLGIISSGTAVYCGINGIAKNKAIRKLLPKLKELQKLNLDVCNFNKELMKYSKQYQIIKEWTIEHIKCYFKNRTVIGSWNEFDEYMNLLVTNGCENGYTLIKLSETSFNKNIGNKIVKGIHKDEFWDAIVELKKLCGVIKEPSRNAIDNEEDSGSCFMSFMEYLIANTRM